MIDDIVTEMEDAFGKAHQSLVRELGKVRTGRASPSLLERVRIDYYGSPTPLNQVAGVKAPEARLLVIQPFDPSILSDIERAIHQSDLGLNPNNDGTVIRIPIPPLTGERRKELAKQVRKYGEDAKISLRNARRDANEMIKSLEKDGDISEDEMHRALADVQAQTDAAVEAVDTQVAEKEKQVLEV